MDRGVGEGGFMEAATGRYVPGDRFTLGEGYNKAMRRN